MEVISLSGTEHKLYGLVAPLVMNPEILSYNQNYPFKTGENYTWFVAVEKRKVVGFMPLEKRGTSHIINNYYVNPHWASEGFKLLLEKIEAFVPSEESLQAVVQVCHKEYFTEAGFEVTKEWKLYVKMSK